MKTDLDLNSIWERRYILGNDCHLPIFILSTTDGGCLITGFIHKGEERVLFVLKVTTDGLLKVPDRGIMDYPYRLFPNPVDDRLNIHYSPDVTPKAVELYDLQGRLTKTQDSDLESVGMENLPAGNYTLRVLLDDGKIFTEKVVKQ